MEIDLDVARNKFKEYVKKFNLEDEKIKLKVKHTLKVMKISGEIAEKLKLSEEERKLAQIIGLLHDIGRFEQVRRYNTFIDRRSIDHGELGVEILFKNDFIREFIEDSNYDEIIRFAILNHNKKLIEENVDEKALLHTKIVRDADKLDIYRVSTENPLNISYRCEKTEDEEISKKILDDFYNSGLIDYKDIRTTIDKFLCNISYVFDLNFKYSFTIMKKKKYIDKLYEKVVLKTEQIEKQVDDLVNYVNDYIDSKCGKD